MNGARDDSGSSLVELVLLVPVIMVLLLLAVQCALWAHAAQVVQLAASEGDRAARSLGGGPGTGTSVAESVTGAPGSDVTHATVSVTLLPGDAERMAVSGHALAIISGLSFPVSAAVSGPLQEFRGSE